VLYFKDSFVFGEEIYTLHHIYLHSSAVIIPLLLEVISNCNNCYYQVGIKQYYCNIRRCELDTWAVILVTISNVLRSFVQFLCPSSGVFHFTHSNGIYRTGLLTYTIVVCVQWKTPDDGQRNFPKHIEFHSKNKFEKLVHLVGFIIRNLTRCTVTRTSNLEEFVTVLKVPLP
jgi:hypothetical protein